MVIAILIDAWLPFFGGGQKNIIDLRDYITKNNKKKYKIRIFHGFSANIFLRIFWTFLVIPQVLVHNFFKEKIDIIDARPFLAGIPAKIVSFLLRIPVIYTVNGCASLDLNKRGLKACIEKLLLTKIKYARQVSDSRHFLKYKNINKNILVIPNGLDVVKFDKVFTKKEKTFTLISVGRLTQIKGQKILLKAMKKIIDKKIHLKLKIIGTGEDKIKLKKYVNKNKLGSYVSFLGQITGMQLIRQYKSADLFVLTSLAEGMPNTVLEAWAAKLPVVATRVGSLAYLVTPENGYLVKSGDVNALADTIIKAVNNKKLQALGINGYKLVKSEFSINNYVQKYLNLYEDLA